MNTDPVCNVNLPLYFMKLTFYYLLQKHNSLRDEPTTKYISTYSLHNPWKRSRLVPRPKVKLQQSQPKLYNYKCSPVNRSTHTTIEFRFLTSLSNNQVSSTNNNNNFIAISHISALLASKPVGIHLCWNYFYKNFLQLKYTQFSVLNFFFVMKKIITTSNVCLKLSPSFRSKRLISFYPNKL